jgi:putative hemolysin
MIFEIVILFVLIGINALFVVAEMSIISVRESRLQELYEAGDRRAKIALDLLKSPENFLSTIQVGISLITILSGAVGGASLAEKFAPSLAEIPLPFISQHAHIISFFIVVFCITFVSIILGELVPKRWALSHAESLALPFAAPVHWLMVGFHPIVKFFSASARVSMKVLGIRSTEENPVTEEEIKIILEQGEKAGVVDESEKVMIEQVFRLGDRRIDSLMTHRKDIIWVDIENIEKDTWKKLSESGHTNFPVCKESIDEVVGIISIKDLWLQLVDNGNINIQAGIKEPLIVPGTISATRVLERFRETRKHVALVVDEYGSLDGLVTVNDIVEAVMGEFPNLDDDTEPAIVERDDGSYLLDGALPFDDFEDLLDLPVLAEDEKGDFQTLAGFIIDHLGRFPKIGERFEWGSHIFEIVDMDGHRVDRVMVTPPAKSDIAESDEDML